jgi:hypothetical protein
MTHFSLQGGNNQAAVLVFEPDVGEPDVIRFTVGEVKNEMDTSERNRQRVVDLIRANKRSLRSVWCV